jgi:hypothetical protein
MDTNQPTTVSTTTTPPVFVAPPPARSGGKIPSTVAYAVGILLFLMPFVDIKCNNMSLQQVTGLQLATGFKMKNSSSDNPFLNDVKTDQVDTGITKATTGSTSKDPNLYALIALALGGLGLILSLTNARAAVGGGIVTGVGAAGALIGMMLDVKNKVKLDMPDVSKKTPDNDVGDAIDKIGDSMKNVTDNVKITVDFTPWFYIAVVAFLVAAFFCYRRLAARRL